MSENENMKTDEILCELNNKGYLPYSLESERVYKKFGYNSFGELLSDFNERDIKVTEHYSCPVTSWYDVKYEVVPKTAHETNPYVGYDWLEDDL